MLLSQLSLLQAVAHPNSGGRGAAGAHLAACPEVAVLAEAANE